MADNTPNLTELTVDLLSAYLGASHHVRPDDLPSLIASTHAALAALDQPAPTVEPDQAQNEPEHVAATTARRSLASRDLIVSMIVGKNYNTLKRPLSSNAFQRPIEVVRVGAFARLSLRVQNVDAAAFSYGRRQPSTSISSSTNQASLLIAARAVSTSSA